MNKVSKRLLGLADTLLSDEVGAHFARQYVAEHLRALANGLEDGSMRLEGEQMTDTDFVNYERKIARLKRKLEKRDQKIRGMEREIVSLQSKLAQSAYLQDKMPREIEKLVQRALSNMRLIPALGIGSSTKILEVRALDKDNK
jgi:CII-binding regulator of phage lambda lysogenization HflD